MDNRKILTIVLLAFVVLVLLEWVIIPLFGARHGGSALPVWQHPPKALLHQMVNSYVPDFFRPAGVFLFWAVGLGMWLMFRRISAGNVLSHPERERIYSFIRDHPGLHFRELERQTGINRGTLAYHLGMLGQMNKIHAVAGPRYTRYFENGGAFSGREQQILCSCSTNRRRDILRHLLQAPVTAAELREKLQISGPLVSWHMKRLCRDRMVMIRDTGGKILYVLDPEVRVFLQDRESAVR